MECYCSLGIVYNLYCVGEYMKNIITILILTVLIVGCTRYVEVEKNITIEKIVYQNITTIVKEKCNNTFTDVYDISKSRELDLIRRIRFLESRQDDCFEDIDCEEELEDCEEDLDDIEDELIDCEDELCDLNSSLC